MQLLADENFPRPVVNWLREAGHGVFWIRTDLPGARDVEILDLAEEESRILLTLDRDFWRIGVQRRVPLSASGVVLFRVHPATPANIQPLVEEFVKQGRDWRAHISTVSAEGIQMISASRG